MRVRHFSYTDVGLPELGCGPTVYVYCMSTTTVVVMVRAGASGGIVDHVYKFEM